MVLVPLKDKVKLYTYFLKEGVFACKKDNTSNNPTLNIPNLHCFLVMRSLVSRKMATEIFSWQWHYYFLTKQGVEYLREYLGLPANIVPNTYKLDEQEEQKEEGGEENEEKKGERKEEEIEEIEKKEEEEEDPEVEEVVEEEEGVVKKQKNNLKLKKSLLNNKK